LPNYLGWRRMFERSNTGPFIHGVGPGSSWLDYQLVMTIASIICLKRSSSESYLLFRKHANMGWSSKCII
jgi:hypothetical protein